MIINRCFYKIILLTIVIFLCATCSFAGPAIDYIYDEYGIEFAGFAEIRQGFRLKNDPYEKDSSISEGRIQLAADKNFDHFALKIKGDVANDLVEEDIRTELREFNLFFSPYDKMDVKIGRQTLTWGTGDLLFINDLFPKDWKSFFIGRDDEYLKAPTDAIKASFFFDVVDIDVVYSPLFNESNYIDGSRLSYWNTTLGRVAGRDFVLSDQDLSSYFNDNEISLRFSKTVESNEYAFYLYHGYWKTPEGFEPENMTLFFPELSVFGASARSPLMSGIGNVEIGYYDSRDDPDGSNPFIRNSEMRFLFGFERELGINLIGAMQYYIEWMLDHKAYAENLVGMPEKDKYREVITMRLTKLMMNQNLILSLFTYFSPSDMDAHFRPKVKYKLTDEWTLETGANIFIGENNYTFFGQFEDNSNIYAGIRLSF